MAKKVWSLIRAMFFMLKKGIISKVKLFADLNTIIKRGKIAGKPLHHLHFPSGEYEFSCTDTPPYPLSLFSGHKKHQNKHHRPHTPLPPLPLDNQCNNDMLIDASVMKALKDVMTSAAASPGFGRSPVVKQLRITDSPFPLSNGDRDGDAEVDEAADKFIMRFYNDLRREINK